jgi:glycosyltransferase involved in cell wall biosynthesis
MNPNYASTTVPTAGWFKVLRPQGLQPVLVSHKIGAFHAWATEQAVPAYHVPLSTPSKFRPWPFLRSLWRLRALVRQHDIQLIHCNEQNIYLIGRYLGWLCHIPVVVSVHFTMERSFCTWAFGGRRRPRRMFFLSRGSQDACRPGVEGVVPESDWRLLANGLDLDQFRPDPALRSEFRRKLGLTNELLIGVACALRPRKQLEHLFEAAARLTQPDLRVVVAGGAVGGDEAYAEKLLRDGRAKLRNRLLCLGHLDELRELYNGLDLFVNTSREEACSISVIESLACGCPVVGYPSKSVDEQILPRGGEIVAQDDVDALTAVLGSWLSDANNLADRRRSARQRAEQSFDIRKLSAQLWDEYQTVLHGAA